MFDNTTQSLIDSAEQSLDSVQNNSWRGNYNLDGSYDPSQQAFVSAVFADAQTRALIAIARELKRFNDNSTVERRRNRLIENRL